MHLFDQISSSFLITREQLRAGVVVSLLSVWVLVALFYYLNRYTKRRYFTIWTAAWLFYALWITLSFGLSGEENRPLAVMLQQWCVGVSAVFLLWGSLNFLGEKVRQVLLGWFIVFLLVWSYIGAFYLTKPEMELPCFWLISLASIFTAVSFFKYRQKNQFVGATLLGFGFFLWAAYMGVYPYMERSRDLTSVALFVSAGLQLLLAVSMIILVLEEVRQTQAVALELAQAQQAEREALQSRVQSSEERYQKLFDQASEAIIITDAGELRILELNHAAERLLGVSRAEAARQNLTAFCQVKAGNGNGALPAGGQELFQFICRQRPMNLTRKDGALLPVEVNGAQVDFDGKAAFQFFLLELTERAKLEQQLRQAEKLSAIGQMISGVAHELNNPLSVVKGYLELVLAHHELNPNTRADLEKAAYESNRAAKLVMNFLSFAREQSARREPVKLNHLIQRVMEPRQLELKAAKTEVTLELDPDLPLISADPGQIQQLLVNLVNNSLQALVDLPRPGRLRIKTRRHGELVEITVEDNGPGVPPQFVDKIFEPFFTTKEVGAGTGLGLSLAHSTMTDHKGRILYRTSALGGAAFVLEFPPAIATEAHPGGGYDTVQVAKPAAAEPLRSGNILVLDDEKSIAEMLGEMLGILGYTPTVCHAAPRALDLLDRQDFDLIISDYRMPGMNGRQFYELAVLKKPELARRIIFLTGDVVNQDTRDYLESTGNPHMAKPFNLSNVKTVVGQVIGSEAEAVAAGK